MSERLECECGADINPKFEGDMGFLFHVVGGHKVSVVATQLVIRKLNTSDDFLTPPELVEAMGVFDLDPCASQRQERPIAGR